jgi:hypothetical protein
MTVGNSAGVNTSGLLMIGIDDNSAATSLGGTLLALPILQSIPIGLPSSGLVMTGALPNDSNLYCSEIFFQAIELDGGASKNVSFTEGMRFHIGYVYP